MAGSALGLELEGLSQEDREFEAAKQFVRFASDAVKNAANRLPPRSDRRRAIRHEIAARRFAPGSAARPGIEHASRGAPAPAAAGCAAGRNI